MEPSIAASLPARRLPSQTQPAVAMEPPQNRPKQSIDLSGWLTTGEACDAAVARGWQGSKGTFRRRLEGDTIPPDLMAIGLVEANFDRRAANPRSNAVRWLRFD